MPGDEEFDNLIVNNVLTIGSDVELSQYTDDTLGLGESNSLHLFSSDGTINLGHGIRGANRAELHLHAIGDNVVDIMFGKNARTDANVRWGISDRAEEDKLIFYIGPYHGGWTPAMVINTDGQVQIPAEGSSGGLLIGGDANLYCASANLLKTDSVLAIKPPLIANFATVDYDTDEIWMGKNGSPTANLPRWTFSMRSNNKDFWLYSYDGTTFKNFIKFNYESNTIEADAKQLMLSYQFPQRTKTQIVDCIYRYVGSTWSPLGLPASEASGRIQFYDTTSPHKSIDLFGMISTWSDPYEFEPLLATNVGLVVQKDIAAGGYISANQGELWLGHGREDYQDVPKIVMMHSGYETLYLRKWVGGSVSQSAHLDLGNLTAHGFVDIQGGTLSSLTGYGYLNSSGSAGYEDGSSGTVGVSLKTSYRIFCGGEIDVYSDQRDKNLVDNLSDQTALSAVMKLNPLHFVWKPETKKGNAIVAGFFAQEVAEVIPEAVTVQGGARYSDEHTLNYNVLTTYALSAIQGLIRKHNEDVARLAKEIEDLRSEIQ
jgi:hypothetical protein